MGRRVRYKSQVGKRSEQVNVRLTPREQEIVRRIADERGLSDSAVVRMALLEYDRRHPAPPEKPKK